MFRSWRDLICIASSCAQVSQKVLHRRSKFHVVRYAIQNAIRGARSDLSIKIGSQASDAAIH